MAKQHIIKSGEYAGKTIDGGWSDLTAISELQLLGLNINGDRPGGTGHGDTLKIYDTSYSGLDFSSIAEGTFRGIERIELDGGQNNIQNLTYDHIVSMTDDANTLIFTGTTNDFLDFDFTGHTQTDFKDDQWITDQGITSQFDIYQYEGDRGTVTILIEQDGGGYDNFALVSGL